MVPDAIRPKVLDALSRLRSEGKGQIADLLEARLSAPPARGSAPHATTPGAVEPSDVVAVRAEVVALRQSMEVTLGSLQRSVVDLSTLVRLLIDELGGIKPAGIAGTTKG